MAHHPRIGRRINAKVSAALLVVSVLLVVGLIVARQYQVKRRLDALMRQAVEAERTGHEHVAAEWLAHYLSFQPKDNEAYARYALLRARTANRPQERQEALRVLVEAIKRRPDRQDLHREAVTLAMRDASTFAAARTHLDALLGNAQPDATTQHLINTGDLDRMIGECLEHEGQAQRAADSYRKSIGVMPAQIESYARLAQLLLGPLKAPKDADQVMEQMVASNPGNGAALMARSNFRLERGQEVPDEEISKALALAPENPDILVASAVRALVKEPEPDLGAARDFLKHAMSAAPNDLRSYLLLSALELRSQNATQAMACLREGLGRVTRPADRAQLLVLLAESLIQSGRAEEAATAVSVSQIEQNIGDEGYLWRIAEATRLVLRAQVSLQQDALDRTRIVSLLKEAQTLLDDVATARPSWSGVAPLQARIALLGKDVDLAIENYRRAIKLGERGPGVVGPLAELLLQRGRLDEAAEVLRVLPRDTGRTHVIDRLEADLLVQKRDSAHALELVDRVTRPNSADYRDFLWRGAALTQLGKDHWAEAEAAYNQAVRLGGAIPETWLSLVSFLVQTQQQAKLAPTLLAAEKQIPAPLRPLTLAQCQEIAGDGRRADSLYREALSADPTSATAPRCYAGFLVRKGRTQEAQPLLRKILAPFFNAPAAEVVLARRLLANCLSSETDQRLLTEAMGLIEKNLASGLTTQEDQQIKILLLSRQPSRRKDAIALMEAAVARPDPSANERLVLARLYEEDGRWRDARPILARLAESPIIDSRIRKFVAGALLQHGEPDAAKPLIDRLVQEQPDDLQVAELRARWLHATHKTDEAINLLKTHADAHPTDRVAAGRLIELLSPGGAPAAEAIYRSLAAPEGPKAGSLVLADYYARHNQPEKAIELCDVEDSHAPLAVAQICLTALQQARPKPAEAVTRRVERWFNRAVAQSPGLVELRLQQAIFRTYQGQEADAIAVYRQVLGADSANIVAMNNLAWLLSFSTEGSQEAIALIDRAIAEHGPSASLSDTRGTILIRLGRGADALRELHSALERGGIGNTRRRIQFHIAQAALLEHDRKQATEAFQAARTAGLNAEGVDPLEKVAFEQLARELADSPAS